MTASFDQFKANYIALQEQVSEICRAHSRTPESVKILPVTKNHPPLILNYMPPLGITHVGENRVQEIESKLPHTPPSLSFELIGHLQSNKINKIISSVSRIQSVDSLKLAQKLNSRASELNLQLTVLIQVNTGKDPNKYGFATSTIQQDFESLLKLDHLTIEGLMTIAPLDDNPDVARRTFYDLRTLRDSLSTQFGVALPELSIGMSGDMHHAIAEGSTLIRVGTALLGSRGY